MGKFDSPRPNADGSLRGDESDLPNRGTRTGLNGDTYGADIGPDATNSMGRITSATKSDDPGEDSPQGNGTSDNIPGDAAEDAAEGKWD